MINTDYLIVGCGLYGSVLAERIANVLKKKVTIIEKRNHIGGNCYSEIDKKTGIEYHKYGTHIFHTSNGPAIVLRKITETIPEIASLNLPPVVSDIIREKAGLIEDSVSAVSDLFDLTDD